MVPRVVFQKRRPVVVSRAATETTWQERCRHATTFEAAIATMEKALRDQAGWSAIATDFIPDADWACRFLNSTAAGLMMPPGSLARRQAERAKALVWHLLFGSGAGRRPTSRVNVATIVECRRTWRIRVKQVMQEHVDWMTTVGKEANLTAQQRIQFATLSYRHVRPCRLGDYLASCVLGISVRAVRVAKLPREMRSA